MSETTFWLSFWGLMVVVIIGCLVSIQVSDARNDRLTMAMIEQGWSANEIKCYESPSATSCLLAVQGQQ